MAESAKVLSIQSLKDFRVALVTFTEEARNALGGVDMELKRMRDWLERDQLSYWQMQVKRRHEAMMMARTELYRRRISQQGSDAISDTEQKEALKEAQRRLRIAEEKVEAVKKLIPIFHHAMAEYVSRAAPLTDHLSGGVDRSLGSLTKMIDSLEAYLALNAPAAPPVESMGVSSAGHDFGSCRRLSGRSRSRRPRPGRGWPGPGSRQGWRTGSGRRRGSRFFTGSGDFHGTEIEPGARIMSAHSSRLQHALKDLREKWDITRESWADQVALDFEKNHLDSIEHLVKHTIVGMDKLSESLGKIRRQCQEND